MNRSTSAADRHLLLGVLALHTGFIRRETLQAGVDAWLADREVPLADHLVRLRALTSEQQQVLAALVEVHVRQHGGDPRQSLEALDCRLQIADCGLKTESAIRNLQSAIDSPTRYRILRSHAEGGLGQVFVARDEEVGREVALKEIKPRFANHVACRARFTREAEITGGLEHPGIVPVYGLGAYPDGRPYYAMRFIRGTSLKEAIEAFHGPRVRGQESGDRSQETGLRSHHSPLTTHHALSLTERNLELRQLLARLIDVCQAIDYAHSRGVLHRDLKPGNVMLGRYGETLVVDWGLAKALHTSADETDASADEEQPLVPSGDSAPTRLGAAIGTPGYMSPEQAAGRLAELGPASDVFSLGATLYHLLVGAPPYCEGDLVRQAMEADYPPPRAVRPDVPRPLEAICLKAMELRPQDRYASARELADEIDRWLAGEPVRAYRERFFERAFRWVRKHRTWVTAGGLALAIVTAVTTVALVIVSFQNWEIAALAAAEERDRRIAEQRQREAETARKDEAEARRRSEIARQQAHDDRARLAEIIDQLGDDIYRARRHRPLLESGITNCRNVLRLEDDSVGEPLVQARFQAKLATLLEALGDYPRATAAYLASIAQYEALLADGATPSRRQLQSELGTTYGNLGAMYVQTPETLAALSALDKAIGIQKKLAEAADATAIDRRELARHYYNRGYVRAHHELSGASADLEAALKLQRTVASAEPQSSELALELAVMEIELGVRQAAQTRQSQAAAGSLDPAQFVAARELVQSGVTKLEGLVGGNQANTEFRKELADGYAELAQAEALAGEPVAAAKSLAKSMDGFSRLLADHPADPDFRRGLALARATLGLVQELSGDTASAGESYQSAAELQERLVAEFPDRALYCTDAAKTWSSLSALRLKDQNLPAALVAMKTAAMNLRQAWKLGGFSDQLRPSVYDAYMETAKIAVRAGDHGSLAELGQSHAALRPENKQDLFDAARLIAVAAALADSDRKLSAAGRQDAASKYADASIELLGRAVARGFRDARALASDEDLAAVRSRPEFAELLVRLRKP